MPVIITFTKHATMALLMLKREGINYTLYQANRIGLPVYQLQRARVALAQIGILI
jgi:hypothetical protein